MSKMLILVGLPGSGKSTTAKHWYPDFVRVNQDMLGSREACIKEVKECLEQGFDVIIDRCNLTKKQRSHWVNLGLQYGVEYINCIVLDVNAEECVARIHARKDHETITPDMLFEKKHLIVYNFLKDYEQPELAEGFNSILITRN